MALKLTDQILRQTVDKITAGTALSKLYHEHHDGRPLPSAKVLKDIIQLVREIVFPGYFGKSEINLSYIDFKLGASMQQLHEMLTTQVLAGLCFTDDDRDSSMTELHEKAEEIATKVIIRLPELQEILATDVEAAYNGDPAAVNYGEIISCYPIIRALTNYRLAHELHVADVPLIPRILTEMAHSETGIDIHPGAQIGHHFTIDHGTGVVIGATCIIGNNVKLYQGVTLGAKSFPLDDDGNPIKGIPRHPILEDDVIVYANATILGRITIARGTVVGGNMWVTESTKPNDTIYQNKK